MISKIAGGGLVVFGFFLLMGAPGDRAQMVSYGNTGRVVGLILMALGVILIKL